MAVLLRATQQSSQSVPGASAGGTTLAAAEGRCSCHGEKCKCELLYAAGQALDGRSPCSSSAAVL